MITILNTKIKKISHIVQCADIHIKLNARHTEYRSVFETFYNKIKKTPDTTIVVCCGDILHNKNELSPECIQLASDFFTNIANIRPLIIIGGNHDQLIANKSRLDSISPIIDALNNPNIYYLKTSGLYGFGNILFNNMAITDSPDNYIRGKDIPSLYRNEYKHIIALFHGAVNGAKLDTGYLINNPIITTSLFDSHHLALLGDIHKCQNMQEYDSDNNKPCVRFVGSIIQQDHGEALKGHGYSLWDLSDYSYTHHELLNECGYFTVEVNKGQLTTDLADLPQKVRLRIKCYESIPSEVKAVIATIKEKAEVIEIAHIRMDTEQDKKVVIPLCKDIVLTDLTNVDYQNRLITDFLKKKLQLTDTTKIKDIIKINTTTNSLIKRDDFARNLKWKPIRMEWSNMFIYGEDNSINFENMTGAYGIFGPNKSGKSSIFSTLIFILFDKCERAYKGNHVLNVQKTSFKCKLEFEISEVRYFIERKGSIGRNGSVKVDVRFWHIKDGIEEELHGNARRDTNDIIRDYVGTYDDFILTTVSFQNAKNSTSFIDLGNSERKDLLVRFMGLNVFDRLHESGADRNKELTTILKLHKDKNYLVEIQESQLALQHATSLFDAANTEVEGLKKKISDINEEIIAETTNLIRLDANVPTDLPSLETRKITAETALHQKRAAINRIQNTLIAKEKELLPINKKVENLKVSDLVESHGTYNTLTDKINVLNQKINLKKVEVRGKLEKVDRLKKHEYDPNCKYCTNNSFVKDATKAKKELVEDKKETDKMMNTMSGLKVELAKYQWVEKAYETYTELIGDQTKIKDEIAVLSKDIIISTNELEKLDVIFKTVTQQIELYNKNVISVKANSKVQAKIAVYRATLSRVDGELRGKSRVLMEIAGKKELYINQINSLTKTIKEVAELEYELDLYTQYLAAVGRDGISYQIICNIIIEIEKEVNSILSQIVDFTVQFETDGKNIVPYISYSDRGKWPIELTSGFERSVISIAIKVAIVEISNLPKCNYCAIDESFSTLDAENLASIPTLFSILKNYYDFLLVISHLDALKDATDKQIEITHENGLAKVVFG